MQFLKGQTKLMIIIMALGVLLGGCSGRNASNGDPVEPIAPGVEKGEAQALQGGFSVRSSDVQIRDLAVTRSGSLTLVATASRGVYLLEGDGNLSWEMAMSSEPLVTYLEPEGRYLAVGTAGGKLLIMDPDQTERATKSLDGPVDLISVSGDGENILIRVSGKEKEEAKEPDTLLLLNKEGEVQWEKTFPAVLDAKIAGRGNDVFINWLEEDEPMLGVFSIDGNPLWERAGQNLMSLDTEASMLFSARENQVFRYNRSGTENWSYEAEGTVNRIILARDGSRLALVITDEATQNQQLLYLNAYGEKLWSVRLPDESNVVLSPNGRQVIVSSWRQYRDDSTHVITYNQDGEEINSLGVAGRAEKMVLADRTSVLVLGLEDGRVYYLSIQDQSVQQSDVVQEMEKTVEDYYNPVSFTRGEGESLITLFFYDENASNLIPVTRRIKRTSSLLRSSIDELVRGPVQGSRLSRTIPKDAQVGVSVEEGIVQLDLPAQLDEMAGSTFITGVLDSLLFTVSQFPTVEQVRYTVDGQEQEFFGQEGMAIDEPFASRRFGRQEGERLIFAPAQSGDRYYLRMATNEFLPLRDRALIETLVRYVLAESQPFFSYNLELQDVTIENSVVHVDLAQPIRRHLGNDAESAARAAMLRDAISLTIAENAYYSQIQITVDGEIPQTSQLYLPWSSVISRPYFINLED
ncbi:GerMN domain-containing protein [Dethiobacter alkaliphilus]|uniref:GerMN domain-containing protein n=1 Tax=Dethiobacter alkaliphilus TaxID=427926 RepID=UPI00222692F3|nr:GerMN domain-containing protein [Dethiobacter alkaliphilus]MCW3489003.1 GerMN domain-containing protein [Dethiobacter alkaliphilus]